MKSLYLRIWLTVVAALALFALASGWLVQRELAQERARADEVLSERTAVWAELIQNSIPGPDAPAEQQVIALRDWSRRLRVPLALHDAKGARIGASESYLRRETDGSLARRTPVQLQLEDGRVLWVLRPGLARLQREGGVGDRTLPEAADGLAMLPAAFRAEWPAGLALAALLVSLFMAVAAGAFPVVRKLTRRLEQLQRGVEAFGAGALDRRVPVEGRDEVASLASSFNRAAARIESLVTSHQRLLANASHELRSPLARLKMALALLEEAAPASRDRLRNEIATNIAELDALVEEVLLSSRLDAGAAPDLSERVDVVGLAAEESARAGAVLSAPVGRAAWVRGSERLLRRAIRNLLENARRYGGEGVEVSMQVGPPGVSLAVDDRGPGVPDTERERIFEPFYRLPGHAEREGGVGLGLALVRQIAQAHGGQVRCEGRAAGGSRFVLTLPAAGPTQGAAPAEG